MVINDSRLRVLYVMNGGLYMRIYKGIRVYKGMDGYIFIQTCMAMYMCTYVSVGYMCVCSYVLLCVRCLNLLVCVRCHNY